MNLGREILQSFHCSIVHSFGGALAYIVRRIVRITLFEADEEDSLSSEKPEFVDGKCV